MVNENKIDNKNFAFSFISFDNSVEKDNFYKKQENLIKNK